MATLPCGPVPWLSCFANTPGVMIPPRNQETSLRAMTGGNRASQCATNAACSSVNPEDSSWRG